MKTELLVTEWSLLKSKNCINGLILLQKYKVNNVSIQDKQQYHVH